MIFKKCTRELNKLKNPAKAKILAGQAKFKTCLVKSSPYFTGIIFLAIILFGFFGVVGKSQAACEAPLGYNCWYVSTTGSDSNPGTFEAPFGTIQHAVDSMSGGDIIYLRDGTYTHDHLTTGQYNTVELDENKDGTCSDLDCTTGSWSTIKSYPGEWAILDGENNCAIHSERPLGLISSGSSGWRETRYWKFEKLEIKNGADVSNQYASGLSIAYGPFIIRNCYIHDNKCEWGGQNPAGIRCGRCENSIIEYNYFKDNGYSGPEPTNSVNFAHITVYSDYNSDVIVSNGYDGVSGARENEYKYNLFEGEQMGIRHKSTQFFTARDPYSEDYNMYGDKIHHNILRDMDNSAVQIDQDFAQVYNNIIENADGIRIGGEKRLYKPTVYNNEIIGGTSASVHTSYEHQMRIENSEYEDEKTYAYTYNNIIDDGLDEWHTNEICLGVSSDGYAIDFIHNWNDFFFQNNYIYRPQNSDIITIFENSTSYDYSYPEFTEDYPQYKIYQNDYNISDPLYVGTTGSDRYITRGNHVLEGSKTIANGGIGGSHPYLDGVTIPSYVGAVNPNDSDWVDGVLGLTNVDYFKNAPSGDPDWIEGGSAQSDTTPPSHPTGLGVS